MISGKRVLALVPARGGSKGVPLKNVQPCAGKPLIAWTIEAAKASKYIDETTVSSDSLAIVDCAQAFGDVSAVHRPAELATDEAEMPPVIANALETMRGFDICVLLQPTSPLRTAEDIDGALELLVSSGAKTVTSVYESYAVPFTGVDPPRRQERKPALYLNGAIYAFRVARFLETLTLIDERTVPFVMPQERSVDVDFPHDMAVAAALIGTMR